MGPRFLAPLLALLAVSAVAQDKLKLFSGMVISKSGVVSADERLTLPPGPSATCLTVRGNDITVDFGGSHVRAEADVYHNRENFNGVGLLIDGCKNVTIKNANIQGFRWNVKIVNSQNVRLENCDLSFSRAIRMMKDGGEIDTWLNLRDPAAWNDYGAGVRIEKSSGCTIEHCVGTGGLVGAMLIDAAGNTIHNSNFSFNGGYGVLMGRSSENEISWNRLDFCNRLYGGAWGADAAGLGIARDSNRNYIVGNSMTHGGDGFFLSNANDVGPHDASGAFSPKGGSNQNVIAYNDGSWSPNNAFEGTFSDGNLYIGNQANYSGYGFWLGFSTNSLLFKNVMHDDRVAGIAIEQGKGTKIVDNTFSRIPGIAIHLWGITNTERAPFPSSQIDIVGNDISDSGSAYDLTGSIDISVKNNKVRGTKAIEVASAARPAINGIQQTPQRKRLEEIVAAKPKDFKFLSEETFPKGVQWIQSAEFGPKDFRGDMAVQRQADSATIELFLLQNGVRVVAPAWVEFGETPEDPHLVRLRAKPESGDDAGDKTVEVTLIAPNGTKQKITGRVRTSLWNLKWFSWRGIAYDDQTSWNQVFAGTPIKAEETASLGGDYTGRAPSEGVPVDHFALAATTRVKLEPGRYIFRALSDDGIRVYVDGRIVINRWNQHGPTADNVPVDLDALPHNIRVEYCQEGGSAVLKLDWEKQPQVPSP